MTRRSNAANLLQHRQQSKDTVKHSRVEKRLAHTKNAAQAKTKAAFLVSESVTAQKDGS